MDKKENRFGKFGVIAIILVLLLCGVVIGAIVFHREASVETPTEAEMPAQPETVELEEIGLTLILPDSWKDRYEVVETTFEPTGTQMWKFCVKSIYDLHTPSSENRETYYEGLLFSVYQCRDYPMSAEEFMEDDSLAGTGRYLFATENATYAIWYATDVQYDDSDPVQAQVLGEEYRSMSQEMKEIRIIPPQTADDSQTSKEGEPSTEAAPDANFSGDVDIIQKFIATVNEKDVDEYISLFTSGIQIEMQEYLHDNVNNKNTFFLEKNRRLISLSAVKDTFITENSWMFLDAIDQFEVLSCYYVVEDIEYETENERMQNGEYANIYLIAEEDGTRHLYRVSSVDPELIENYLIRTYQADQL